MDCVITTHFYTFSPKGKRTQRGDRTRPGQQPDCHLGSAPGQELFTPATPPSPPPRNPDSLQGDTVRLMCQIPAWGARGLSGPLVGMEMGKLAVSRHITSYFKAGHLTQEEEHF